MSRRREFNHRTPEGSSIPVSWAAVRLGDSGPVLAVGRDLRTVSAIQQHFMDAQQEMERDYWQRRQTVSHCRQLFQVAHDAVLVLDADTLAVLDANPAAGALLGAWAAEGVEAKRAKTEDRRGAPTSPGLAPWAQEVIPGETGLSHVAADDLLSPALLGPAVKTVKESK